MKTKRQSRKRGSEDGYILIAILLMVTLIVVALASAVPAIRTQIRRDREEELIRRGRQYERAIQLYYRRLGSYPASIEQLENTNNIRFLRKRYVDPITGKDDWKLIRFGQQHPKTRPAYLGGGAAPAGATPASGLGGPGNQQQQQGKPQAGISNAADISKPLSGSKTLGGGPIVGVASSSEKDAIKELDGKTKYNEWEFVYDPTLDANARQGQNQGGQGGPGGLGGPGGMGGPGRPGTPSSPNSPMSPMGPGMQPPPQPQQPQGPR